MTAAERPDATREGALAALFPSTPPYYVPVHYQTLGIAIVFSAAALVLIVTTRGQLSYQRYLQEAEAEEEADMATAQA